jgi:hypothetical protein
MTAGGLAGATFLAVAGTGDIDSVVVAPTGVAVAIETKTRTYEARHLDRVRRQAEWFARNHRRWRRREALAVLCVVRARGVVHLERGVLVVSIDQLNATVRVASAHGERDRVRVVSGQDRTGR